MARWARALQPLVGWPVWFEKAPRSWQPHWAALQGDRLADVTPIGKHLVLKLATGWAIHCHAMMFGSWQIESRGLALNKPVKHVRLWLRTAKHEAVFYHGPVVELLRADELPGHPVLAALGPDILSPAFDCREAGQRLQQAGSREIGDAILDQNLIAGIGNIYKSEGLFLAGIDPRRHAGEITAAESMRLWEVLIPLMRQGVINEGPIVTLPPALRTGRARYWVYRRTRQPCYRCNTPVAMVRQGQWRRMTYFCPTCQR